MSRDATTPGYRDRHETIQTGDEFLHMLAVVGEKLPGAPPCHSGPDVRRGFWKPGCAACESIMAKAKAYSETCERLGYPG